MRTLHFKRSVVFAGALAMLIGVVCFATKAIHNRICCLRLARNCVEQDAATATWVFDMAKGHAVSFTYSGMNADDVDGSVSRCWIDIGIRTDSGLISTNQYLVSLKEFDAHGTITNEFASKALDSVVLLWEKSRND